MKCLQNLACISTRLHGIFSRNCSRSAFSVFLVSNVYDPFVSIPTLQFLGVQQPAAAKSAPGKGAAANPAICVEPPRRSLPTLPMPCSASRARHLPRGLGCNRRGSGRSCILGRIRLARALHQGGITRSSRLLGYVLHRSHAFAAVPERDHALHFRAVRS